MTFGKNGVLGLILLGALVLILAVISPSMFSGNGNSSAQQPTAKQRWPLAAKGVVESEEYVELASKIEGQVAEILVDEGDSVQSGQLLVRFDRVKIDAQIAKAEAALNYAIAKRSEAESGSRREDLAAAKHAVERAKAIHDEARRNFERQQRLLDQGAVSRLTRDRAEEAWQVALGDFNAARARLERTQRGSRSEELAAARAEEQRQRAELDYAQALAVDYQLTSPVDGVVVNRFRDPFETVTIGTPVLTVVNPAKLRVWAEVEETDVGKVSTGQKVTITVDAHLAREFTGKVTKVYAAVQRKSQKSFDPVATFDINTQKILVALDDYNGLVHGMSVTVRFHK